MERPDRLERFERLELFELFIDLFRTAVLGAIASARRIRQPRRHDPKSTLRGILDCFRILIFKR